MGACKGGEDRQTIAVRVEQVERMSVCKVLSRTTITTGRDGVGVAVAAAEGESPFLLKVLHSFG